MDHGKGGLPCICRISFVMMVYLSSVSSKRPSISKRQARMRGNLQDRSERLVFIMLFKQGGGGDTYSVDDIFHVFEQRVS